jgi:hypothetical protein
MLVKRNEIFNIDMYIYTYRYRYVWLYEKPEHWRDQVTEKQRLNPNIPDAWAAANCP